VILAKMDISYSDLPLTVFSCKSKNKQAESYKFGRFKVCDDKSVEIDGNGARRLQFSSCKTFKDIKSRKLV
jgi:hypothetical protein